MCIFTALHPVGCAGYGAFITAYAVVALGESEAHGQLLTAAYWASIMIGRIAAIPISLYVSPEKYLGLSMSGCVLACIVMLIGQASTTAMWVSSIAYGLFMACVFPTAVALAESYFPVHGGDATAFVVGSASGEWLIPFLIASLFGNVPGDEAIAAADGVAAGPTILPWVVAVACTLNVGVYVLMRTRGRGLKRAMEAAHVTHG